MISIDLFFNFPLRFSDTRDTSYDYEYGIVTFREFLQLIKDQSAAVGRTLGIAPEVKNPQFIK